ncbi:HPP family protein [Serratia entomophila]|uniref:HPP family protein n=1 Tax=Serratia entomophila TaxID=42906 RepID=UPI00217B0ABA|nr:HPP family protein [Serratia entomophila]CAI1073218.1 HPP family [Serratia entomophila]CAI1737296.1 HPP family [Serratia entomophila]CAI1758268.1 HPP family [Serratia entomophila]CAI1813540.1 HPP family [Serratia entomophila]CAI1858448.1 HPP family [Serratia entomophila]
MKTQWIESVKVGCARLWPHPLAVGKKEILLSSLGAGLGLTIASWVSHFILGEVNLWFIAPMGASAVLLFGVPNSPLAQPWSIVGGNTLAAAVGVSCGLLIADPGLACGLAACLAIGLMFRLRCLHPPGGAVALTAILGGPGVHQMGYHFVLYPVLLNSLLLAALAVLFNNLAGRRYPHTLAPAEAKPANLPIDAVSITRADLHQALMQGELFDIDEDDLQEILLRAEQLAHRRQNNNVGR